MNQRINEPRPSLRTLYLRLRFQVEEAECKRGALNKVVPQIRFRGGRQSVSEPRAVATGSRTPVGFLKVPHDPVATARGSDTKEGQEPT